MSGPTWIRIAGHAERIRNADRFPWRCYFNREEPEVRIKSFCFKSEASPVNVVPGTNSRKDKLGLVAWLDVFGTFEIIDDVLVISLSEPNKGA